MRWYRSEFFLLSVFFLLVHLLYYPTWNAGFVTDFTGLLARMEGSTAWGILDSFGFPALQQVLNAFLFVFCKTFGTSPLPWYLVFTSMHALNGYLLYRFGAAVLHTFGVKQARLAALLGAAFFLLSPYQSEVVTWRVCFNFLLSTMLLISSLAMAHAWLAGARQRSLWAAHVLLLLAFFTFELAFAIPFMTLALLLAFPAENQRGGSRWRHFLKLSLPQFGLLAGYLLLNRWMLGEWVGHYGPEVHLRFDPQQAIAHYLLYGWKLLAFTRYFPHPIKEKLVVWMQEPAVGYAAAGVVLIVLLTLLYYYRQLGSRGRAVALFFFFFVFALGPVINLFFNYILYIENDRYGYLASAFFFIGLSTLLSGLPRRVYATVALLFIAASSFFLWQTNQYWKHSTHIYYSLLDGFRWYDQPAVYLLNLPDNYKGAVLFRDYSGQGLAFRDALRYIKQEPFEHTLYEVAQYNMTRPWGGASVRIDSTHQLTVEFNQWGNWWWRNGIGMGPGYETNHYQVESKGHFYHLQLDTLYPNSVFLYQVGAEWKEVQW